MKFLLIFSVIYLMGYTYFPFFNSIAQVPMEEFAMNKTCSAESELNHYEKEIDEKIMVEGEEFLIYNNASIGFKIEYPTDWKGVEQHCILEKVGFIQTVSTINFMSTPNSKEYGLLGIMVSDIPKKNSIDEWAKAYNEDFGSMIKSKEIITLDGKPSAKFIMTDGNNNTLVQIITVSNEKKYDINHPIASWLSNSTMQHMIQSFEIIEDNVDKKDSDSENI